tara:strand:- start:47 stop:1420 length:1374 start_codon:yes stop_codon:yes gene_type:complete
MPTTTVSIGSNQNISTVTPASTSGSNPYVITFTSTPSSSVAVGDLFVISDETTFFATYTYLLTNISGSNYTLKQVDDGGSGMGDMSPYGNFYDMSYQQASGTFKRAFSTITLFEAMVDDASPSYWGSSDDVVGELHADSNFTDATVNFSQKQSLSSVTLSVYEDDRHDGTAESGALWKPTANSGHNQGILRINIDDMTAEWLDISFDSLDSRNTNKAIVLAGTNDDNIIRNNLIHDKNGNPGNTGPFMIHTIAAGASSDTLSIQNNIIYNIVETSSDNAIAINTNLWSGTANIYNNTIYNIDSQATSKQARGIIYGGNANNTTNIKNNLVAKMVADGAASNERAYQKTSGSSTENASNNLSDDTTTTAAYKAPGSDSLQDQTLAQIAFVSTTAGSEDLHIQSSSVCAEAGVDLGTTNEVNIDINGRDRDAEGDTWDIGAHQVSEAAADTGAMFIMFD